MVQAPKPYLIKKSEETKIDSISFCGKEAISMWWLLVKIFISFFPVNDISFLGQKYLLSLWSSHVLIESENSTTTFM